MHLVRRIRAPPALKPKHGAMNLFTYGTLMDPEVWARVARVESVSRPAVLQGYEARRLRGVAWPGLVAAPGVSTRGLLYLNVSAEAMARLDAYEDRCYRRIELPVVLDDGTSVPAQTYLIVQEYAFMVLPDPWAPPV
jgi:gamma-glutamylcyclotransferase (GGCT)/AIG2-like uncharacterized protein YtfP